MRYYIKCQYSGELAEIENIEFIIPNKYRVYIKNRPWTVLIDTSLKSNQQVDEFYDDNKKRICMLKVITAFINGTVSYVSIQEKISLAITSLINLEHDLPTEMSKKDKQILESILDQIIDINSVWMGS